MLFQQLDSSLSSREREHGQPRETPITDDVFRKKTNHSPHIQDTTRYTSRAKPTNNTLKKKPGGTTRGQPRRAGGGRGGTRKYRDFPCNNSQQHVRVVHSIPIPPQNTKQLRHTDEQSHGKTFVLHPRRQHQHKQTQPNENNALQCGCVCCVCMCVRVSASPSTTFNNDNDNEGCISQPTTSVPHLLETKTAKRPHSTFTTCRNPLTDALLRQEGPRHLQP